jgi:excisionase family DNA binding protein
MADRVVLALPDGRWLAMSREQFDAALMAGAEFAPPAATPGGVGAAGPRLLTSEQLAELLSIPSTWFEEAARRDELPCVRVGKYVRFDLDEVLSSLNPRIASARVKSKPLIRQVR